VSFISPNDLTNVHRLEKPLRTLDLSSILGTSSMNRGLTVFDHENPGKRSISAWKRRQSWGLSLLGWYGVPGFVGALRVVVADRQF